MKETSRRSLVSIVGSWICVFGFFTAGAALGGCAADIAKSTAQLHETKPVCKTFAEMAFEPVTYGDELSFEITPEDGSFEFDSGKSYFRAFQLPIHPAQYPVSVTSHFYSVENKIFFPFLILLDEKYRKTRVLTRAKTFRSWGTTAILSKFYVQPNEKFMIIHSTPSLFGVSEFSYGSSTMLTPYGGFLYMTQNVPYAPTGELEIAIGIDVES